MSEQDGARKVLDEMRRHDQALPADLGADKYGVLVAGLRHKLPAWIDGLEQALEASQQEVERLKAAGYHLAISNYSDVTLKELGATLDHDEGKLMLAALEEGTQDA